MAECKTIFIIKGDQALLDVEHNKAFSVGPSEEQAYEDDDGISQNGGSFYGDHGTPAPKYPVLFTLRITTDHWPQDGHTGFMIGRSSINCDVLLNDDSISEMHLSVRLNADPSSVVLQNHSQHGTLITFSKQNESKLLKRTQVLMNFETAEIIFSDKTRIQIQRFDEPANWQRYYSDFIKREDNDAPSLALLRLHTRIETTNASKRPAIYIQGRRLGQGAFAQVFKAVEKYTGDIFAMKLYDKPQQARWEEPEMLERLEHEHIVRYVAYSRPAGRPAELIMEYVQGPNLEEYLDPQNGYPPLSMAEVQDVLRQLLLAVTYLHGKKVTHRDIKPANIILMQLAPIHTKLVDFGLATGKKLFDTHCGTPFYLAPEAITRRKGCSNKVDIFSIGVIALRLFGFSLQTERSYGLEACLSTVLQQRRSLARAQPLPIHLDFAYRLLCESPDDRPSAQACLGHMFFQSDVRLGSLPQTYSFAPDLRTQILRGDDYERDIRNGADYVSTEVADTPDRGFRTEPISERSLQVHEHAEQFQQSFENTGDAENEQPTQHRISRRSAQDERSQSHRSRLGSSSSSAARHKRQKQKHSTSSGSSRSDFVRSDAPSLSSRRDDVSNHAPVLEEHTSGGENSYWLYSNFNHGLPSIGEIAAPSPTGFPDTASFGSSPEHQASERSRYSPQRSHRSSSCQDDPSHKVGNTPTSKLGSGDTESEAEYYNGCWLDPLHVLGGGSFIERQHRLGKTAHAATSMPRSEDTPVFQSLSKLEGCVSCSTEDITHPQLVATRQTVENDQETLPLSGDGFQPSLGTKDNQDDLGDDNHNDYYSDHDNHQSQEDEPERNKEEQENTAPKAVRHRKKTSSKDKARLEAAYQQNPRPGRDERLRIQQDVSMSEKQVQIWFQNRRHLDRRGVAPPRQHISGQPVEDVGLSYRP